MNIEHRTFPCWNTIKYWEVLTTLSLPRTIIQHGHRGQRLLGVLDHPWLVPHFYHQTTHQTVLDVRCLQWLHCSRISNPPVLRYLGPQSNLHHHRDPPHHWPRLPECYCLSSQEQFHQPQPWPPQVQEHRPRPGETKTVIQLCPWCFLWFQLQLKISGIHCLQRRRKIQWLVRRNLQYLVPL